MSFLTYGLKSWKDLYEKLKRDAQLLEEEVNSDRFFNFVITAYHLCEWVAKDPNVGKSAQDEACDLKNPNKTDVNNPISICRDIADASKHFGLNSQRHKGQVTRTAKADQGYDVGRYGKGKYGEGEEQITITLSDNSVRKVLPFKSDVLKFWHDFLHRHSLIS